MSSLSVVAFVIFLGNFVFSLDPVQGIPFKHLGCFKDTGSRALTHFLGRFTKHRALKTCANLAMKKGYTTFAVQDGGQCFSGSSADQRYNMYGRASNCRGGVGGSWAQDVYQFPLYILLKKLRDDYTRKFRSLKQHYQSISQKERSLRNRLSALNRRVSRARVVCNNKATSWKPYSKGAVMFLDRHHVKFNCPHGQFVASFYLTRSANRNRAPIRYIYRCCKFVL